MTVSAVVGSRNMPSGVEEAPDAPAMSLKTLNMSIMGLPVMLKAAAPLLPLVLDEELLAGAGELAGALCTHGDWGHSASVLMGLLTVFKSRPASFAPLLSTDTLTAPAQHSTAPLPLLFML